MSGVTLRNRRLCYINFRTHKQVEKVTNTLLKNIGASCKTILPWFFVLTTLAFTGCAKEPGWQQTGGTLSVASPDFFGISEDFAQQLTKNMRRPLGNGKRLIMTTFVDIDDLYHTSRFGRTLTESLSTRLFNHGFNIVEIRKSSELLIKDQSGELILTRQAALLTQMHPAEAILAGTYSLTPNSVIINIKLLDASSQQVVSVAGRELQRSHTVNVLLSDTGGTTDPGLSAYER